VAKNVIRGNGLLRPKITDGKLLGCETTNRDGKVLCGVPEQIEHLSAT
jgi:hypothetical protein